MSTPRVEVAVQVVRVCQHCEKPLPDGSHALRKYHLACAEEVRKAQLSSLGKKVGVPWYKKELTCAVCTRGFVPKSPAQKYCNEKACKVEGLRRAVEAQKERRKRAKEERQ